MFSGTQPSTRYELSEEDLKKAGQVLLWSGASAILGTIIVLVGQFNVPIQWLFLVPIINSVLVAVKKFVDNNLKG